MEDMITKIAKAQATDMLGGKKEVHSLLDCLVEEFDDNKTQCGADLCKTRWEKFFPFHIWQCKVSFSESKIKVYLTKD